MCCLCLDQLGAFTKAASSYAAAVEIFSEWHPDILVSDLGMPGKDGFDLIRYVRSLSTEEGGDIPAAALTAYARDEDRIKALEAGYQTHIAKPVEPGELADEVARLALTEDSRSKPIT
jgi:CheY-like chemotaxis protein